MLSYLLFSFVLNFVFSLPISNKIPPIEAFKFMKQFGYLEQGTSDSDALYSEDAVVDAIKNVQRFGAIPESGVIDNATLQLIRSPRCGVPDIQRISEHRKKRFIIAAPGWKKRNITYFVANWTPKIGEDAVIKYMQNALDAWGRYGRLNFHQIHDPSADIIVAFGRGPHGDGYPFDGPGNILAHAFFPYEQDSLGGDIHFDDDENWKINPSDYDDGVDFFTVAVHELGHSLGLGHSPVPNSIMFPYYRGFSNTFALGYDDILGMYQLYIQTQLEGDDKTSAPPSSEEDNEANEESTEKSSETQTEANRNVDNDSEENKTNEIPVTATDLYVPSTDTSVTSSAVTEFTFAGDYETVDEHKQHETTDSSTNLIPDICEGSFDAVAVLRGEIFIFKDKYVWRLLTKGIIEEGYPVEIYHLFPKLPKYVKRIDAAYQRETDGHIILFFENHYWISDGDNFINGSPRPLTDYGLPAILDKIDAVQVWKKNGKTYFYRNEMFWRYNETNKQMDPGYPHHIKRWRGVPGDLDAATTSTDGFTYFFKGRLYWRFDNHFIKTDEHYPLPAPQNWLGCPETPNTIWWLPPE